MKKYFYTLFMTAFIISSMGFRGCSILGTVIEELFTYYTTAGHSNSLEVSGENEIYGIVVGENGAIYTNTGRESTTWIESFSGTTQSLNFVRTYYIIDSIVACAVGNSGTVLISRDKGINWSDHSIPALTTNLNGFDYLYTEDPYLNYVVCGDNGLVYKSSNTNGNYTWQQLTTNITEKLNTVGAITPDLYLAAGENGKILKTNDGGTIWQNVGVTDTLADFNRLFLGILVNAYGYAWLVGDNGRIYMSTDYGYEWMPRESGTSENLYDITFKNELEGVVVGANGVIRYTSDGGFTWQENEYFNELTTKDIISITGIDPNTASAITRTNNFRDAVGGDTTYIYTVSSEPLVNVENEDNITPAEFRMEQNYPNPFNPSTIIKYSIPTSEFVTLKVYDVLGNEVAILVNEEKPAGNYQVDYKSSNLSSGTYFYKITMGKFSETKKMIVLK